MEPKRLFDLLYWQKEQYNLSVSVATKENGNWKTYSTQDVIEIVNNLSKGLLEKGVGPGDKVAIISENRPEWNFADLAIQQIGAISVPMYPTITVEDYRYIFGHSETKLIFVSSADLYNKSSKAREGTNVEHIYTFDNVSDAPNWKELEKEGQGKDDTRLEEWKAAVKPEDLVTIIYTSGTTGKPKGVMLTHYNIMSNVMEVRRMLEMDEQFVKGQAKILSFLPLCHIFERTACYCFIYLGGSIYYAESMETIAANIQEVKPNLFNTVPRLLEKVYDKIVSKGYELTGVKKNLFFWALNLGLKYEPFTDMGFWYNFQLKIARKLIFSKWQAALGGELYRINCGASALQPRLARVFWAAGIQVAEGYGLTETSPGVSFNIPKPGKIKIGTVGPILNGVEVKIAGDGEILVKGPNVMQGYFKEPEMTADVIRDGWFHTGDIGEIVDGAFLKITDRKKEMFKTSGGKYIAPQPMENKFKESILIEQISVIGDNRKFPSALIVPSFDTLREWCRKHDIEYSTDAEMVKDAKVIAKIKSEVDKYNENFGQWEKIKKFTLMSKPWGIDTEELTPTLKLKRRIINEKYASEIEAMYH
jgi:long-chain acyl-CoA synthetase